MTATPRRRVTATTAPTARTWPWPSCAIRARWTICGDGIDRDCDGIADNDPSCDPFKDNDVTIDVQDVSFDASMNPLISFKDGSVKLGVLDAGPDKFQLNVPFQKNITLNLNLTGARVQMDLMDAGGLTNVPAIVPTARRADAWAACSRR